MKSEISYDEKLERETSEMASKDYGFKPSESELLQQEKNILQKRLVEISNLEGEDKKQKQALKEDLQRRRQRFKELAYEKQLSDQAINLQFSQMTEAGGGFPFKK